jgi:hypothetical protein
MHRHLRYPCVRTVIFGLINGLSGTSQLPKTGHSTRRERLPFLRTGIPQRPSFIGSFEIVFKSHSGCLPNWPRPPQTRSPSFKRLNPN